MRTLFRCCVVAVVPVVVGACTQSPTAPPPIVIPTPSETIIYSKHIAPIFANNCAGSDCHMSGSGGSSQLSLDSWEHTMAGTPEFGAEVIPYKAAKSHLFEHINTDSTVAPTASPRMPLSRDPLPAEQIATIKRWIDEGAKNDQGEVVLSDINRQRVFVTAQADDALTVIDFATQHVMRYIPVGTLNGGAPESPHNIAFSPDKRFLYVNLIVGGTVEKYDARTFEKLATVRVGLAPAQIAVTRDGSTLYVSNFDQSAAQQHFIVRVDASTMIVKDTIFDVGAGPHGMLLNGDESRAYTCNALGDDISEIDTKTMEVTRRFLISPGNPLPPGQSPRYMPYQGVFDGNGLLWVTCRGRSEVRVVDLAAGAVVDSIVVGEVPLIMNYNAFNNEMWVPNQAWSTISIIDAATRKVTATVLGLDPQPHAVQFTRDGKTAFVSCENQSGAQHHATKGSGRAPGVVDVIDVASRRVTRRIEVGSFAAGLVIGD